MKSKIIYCSSIIRYFIFTLVVMSLMPEKVNAQQIITGEVSKTYQITLKDGSVISGILLSVTDKEVIIHSGTMGEVRLQKENIKTMVPVSSINEKKSEIWFSNPNPTRYLLGNSAIPLEKNTGYYQNTWIFVNSFSYAFTNNFSISGGFEIISLMAKGDAPYAYYLNPKVSFKLADNFYAGGSFLYANTLRHISDFGGLGTLNAFGTYGNKNNNITGALGWGWANGNFSSKPVITISGMTRLSKRVALVSENWIVPAVGSNDNYYGIFSYGIRFLGEKTSIDLAFLNNHDIAKSMSIGIPWLDFVINF